MFYDDMFWWPNLISIKLERSPGCEISASWMSISLFNILVAVDIDGRSLTFSCTHSNPTFKNRTASSSGLFISSVGSTSRPRFLSSYTSHACKKKKFHFQIMITSQLKNVMAIRLQLQWWASTSNIVEDTSSNLYRILSSFHNI